jgi:hypothetical protein
MMTGHGVLVYQNEQMMERRLRVQGRREFVIGNL